MTQIMARIIDCFSNETKKVLIKIIEYLIEYWFELKLY